MASNYSCIIVDDEPLAIELLMDSIAILNKQIEVIATYTSWAKALEGLRTQKYDIIFMDISIQGRNGMDLLKCIPDLQSEVVFVTAYADHALKAFQFPTAGYLVKPIVEADLAVILDRAVSRAQNKKLAQMHTQPLVNQHKVGIPDQKSVNYVSVEDIVYLEADNTCTKVVLKNRVIISSYNMGKFKSMLEDKMFYQIHRSYIINLDHVSRYDSDGVVVLSNDISLPISRNLRDAFMNMFLHIKPKG